jgi:hypothetical protein
LVLSRTTFSWLPSSFISIFTLATTYSNVRIGTPGTPVSNQSKQRTDIPRSKRPGRLAAMSERHENEPIPSVKDLASSGMSFKIISFSTIHIPEGNGDHVLVQDSSPFAAYVQDI